MSAQGGKQHTEHQIGFAKYIANRERCKSVPDLKLNKLCEILGKNDDVIREMKTLYPNFGNVKFEL